MQDNTLDDSQNLDLLQVLVKIKEGIFQLFFYLFSKRKVFYLFLTVAIILAVSYSFLAKKTYLSELTLRSEYYSNDYCNRDIQSLNLLLLQGNTEEFGRLLGMSGEQADKVCEVKYANFYENVGKNPDTVLLNKPFKIQVLVFDNLVLDTLQNALVKFLSQNPYTRKREKISLEALKEKIEKISSEIKEVDSLKLVANQSLLGPQKVSGGGLAMFGSPYEPLNVYRESISLYNQQLELKTQLALHESVEIVQPFIKYNKHYSPRLGKSLIVAFIIAFLAAIIYLILKEITLSFLNIESLSRRAKEREVLQ
jgi:hypothetical protein